MSTPLRILGFVALLVAVLAASFGIGRLVGPVGEVDAPEHGHAAGTHVVGVPGDDHGRNGYVPTRRHPG